MRRKKKQTMCKWFFRSSDIKWIALVQKIRWLHEILGNHHLKSSDVLQLFSKETEIFKWSYVGILCIVDVGAHKLSVQRQLTEALFPIFVWWKVLFLDEFCCLIDFILWCEMCLIHAPILLKNFHLNILHSSLHFLVYIMTLHITFW